MKNKTVEIERVRVSPDVAKQFLSMLRYRYHWFERCMTETVAQVFQKIMRAFEQ